MEIGWRGRALAAHMTGQDERCDMVPQQPEQDAERWQAVLSRDRGANGRFWYGVVTTGIYCRPHCPSRPRRENVRFFNTRESARVAGLRACKRCQPDKEHVHGKS
ncbi:Ada metal-binding domain-containing protein [Aestuariivirga sp.]|uniref:Ada metal-binding domain-containing protein n=1 Tax=Aestuariivirga sp. TaxID=2650926 RepID=UPI0030164D50